MHFQGLVPRFLQLQHYSQSVQSPIGVFDRYDTEKANVIDSHLNLTRYTSFIENTLKEWHAPGMAVAIINGNETEARGYGLASVDPPKPVTNSTLFYTGSTTKSFTAAAMSLLIDDKENYPNLEWSSTIKSLIPEEFVTMNEYATNHLTLEDFFSHRSGYPRHEASWPGKTLPEIIHNFRYLPQSTEMRTKMEYSNLGFMMISYIIEKLTGQWLGDFFTERLWKPMGMESTFLSLKDAQKSDKDLSRPYFYKNDTAQYLELPWVDTLETSGAGLTISNVLDYAKYIRVMMNQDGPISAKGHEELRTPRSIIGLMGADVFNGPMLYSLGWMQANYHGERIIFHGGALNGYLAHIAYLPDRKWGVVTMTNMVSPAQNVVLYHLVDEFLEVPTEQKKNLSAIAHEDLEKAKEAKKNLPGLIYPNIPSPPLPHSLPLSNYTGTFYHPAYSNITLYRNCPISTLFSSCSAPLESLFFPSSSGTLIQYGLILKHVSGDHFLATINSPRYANDSAEAETVEARFEIDATGKASRFGIDIRLEGLGKPLIWFDKVA